MRQATEPVRAGVWSRTLLVLEAIKFEHSVFALPFALAAMVVAAEGLPSPWTLLWIVLACVCARSSAMAFNRWADVEYDRANPRTQDRALVTGALDRQFAGRFAAAAAAGFVACVAMLNSLCLALSPVALVILLGYSYVKRFSEMTHFVLGAALGMAPVGAWLAVTGTVEGVAAALTLGVAVAMWTAGFDIIYACQDVEFDRRAGLRSIPETVGVARALGVSSACHAVAFAGFMGFWGAVDLGWASLGAILAIGALLVYEHRIVRPGDMTRVNTAFFTVNGLVSFAFLGGVALDNLLG